MSSLYPKHQASISIEELLQKQGVIQKQWLLTYIDVFVLIIMLVITLLTLSEFEQKQKKQKIIVNALIQSPTKNDNPLLKPNNKPLTLVKTEKKTSPLTTSTIVTKAQNPINQPTHSDQSKLKANTESTSLKNKSTPKPVLPTQKDEKLNTVTTKEKSLVKNTRNENIVEKNNNSLQLQLQKTVDELGLTDAINMKVSLGYAQLEIQDKVLFKSSESDLLTAGKSLLKKLAPLLKKSTGLIYIEGHTDNRPIKTQRFPSNWELGSSRATSVLHFLTSQELESSRLRAITYGDTKPIADNSTSVGREKNRRVSLVIKISDTVD